MASKVWVIDIYDAGEHVHQVVFDNKRDAFKARDLICETEKLEADDPENGCMLSEYQFSPYRVWEKEYLEEAAEEEEEE